MTLDLASTASLLSVEDESEETKLYSHCSEEFIAELSLERTQEIASCTLRLVLPCCWNALQVYINLEAFTRAARISTKTMALVVL